VGGREGFVPLWSFEGSETEARSWLESYGLVADVLLVDEDRSLIDVYFIDEYDPDLDAFSMFPRNFVIDREGNIAHASAQVDTPALVAAIEAALEGTTGP
jgi:peroxiredoxin